MAEESKLLNTRRILGGNLLVRFIAPPGVHPNRHASCSMTIMMVSLCRNSTRRTSSGVSLFLQGAFTLIEMFIALAVLGTTTGGAYIGFNAVNTYAVSTRLYSEAQAAAQNQIDLVLSKAPFDVMISPKKVPLELQTTAELDALSPQLSSSPPPKTDKYYPYYRLNRVLAKEAFVYSDPTTADPSTGLAKVVVTGTLTTTIHEVGDTMTLEGTTTALNTRRATVTVTYVFRGKSYNVSLDTMRTADR